MQKEEMHRALLPQLSEELQSKGFSTSMLRDGTLSVTSSSMTGGKALCSVGENGEVYCNSKDFAIPRRKEHLETVLETVDELRQKMEQSYASEQKYTGGMTFE